MYFVLAYRKTDEKVNTVKDISISTFPDRGDALDEYLHEKQNNPNMRVELLQQIGVAEPGDKVIEPKDKKCEKKKQFSKKNLRTGMVTKFRNGVKSVVLTNIVHSEETFLAELILVSKEYASVDMGVFNDKLEHGMRNEYDIVEIRRFEDAGDMFNKYGLSNDYEELELVWAEYEAVDNSNYKRVSFGEAFLVLTEDSKDIYCLYGGDKYTFSANAVSSNTFKEDWISMGEWYIEC